jgi:hypothetical protein
MFFSMQSVPDGQLYTLGLLEQLRTEPNQLSDASSDAYLRVDKLLRELSNPNLHDIPRNLPFRVELWDRTAQHLRFVGGRLIERAHRSRRARCRYRKFSGRALHAPQRHSCYS